MGRRFAVALAVVCLAAQGAAASPQPCCATLRLGGAAFRPVAGLPLRDTGEGTVREWRLRVARGGDVLRVALDRPSYRSGETFELVAPSGATYGARGWYSMETYAPRPNPGTWIVRVWGSSDSQARLRAKLEAPRRRSSARAKRAPLLPNLRLIPPFELTFADPNGGEPDSATPNCHWDEIAEHTARRCLRFSLGPINAGAGPFRLRFEGNGEGLVLPGRVYQAITYTDGTVIERPAGEAQFHKTHMHYHHSGFGSLELLRVTDARRGRMDPAGAGPKQGFCTADTIIYPWSRFGGHQDSVDSECLSDMGPSGTFSPTGTGMGITPGWADIYVWSQPGNYVEFGDNPDGRYVIRSTADAQGYVWESNERDNTSYAYVEVRGDEIRVLERGFGASPWDRRKQIVRDILLPNPW